MNSRLLRPRTLLRYGLFNNGRRLITRRTLVAAPKSGDGPLMERRADRELPDIPSPGGRWLKTAPIFITILIGCTLAIFNYQKASSPVVSSTMYSLRTSPKARQYLGDEIYFANRFPWIWGEMNQLHGKIDIHFDVKGNKNSGTIRFTSRRAMRRGMFETSEWSLRTKDGVRIDLLEEGEPFRMLMDDDDEGKVVGRELYAPKVEMKGK